MPKIYERYMGGVLISILTSICILNGTGCGDGRTIGIYARRIVNAEYAFVKTGGKISYNMDYDYEGCISGWTEKTYRNHILEDTAIVEVSSGKNCSLKKLIQKIKIKSQDYKITKVEYLFANDDQMKTIEIGTILSNGSTSHQSWKYDYDLKGKIKKRERSMGASSIVSTFTYPGSKLKIVTKFTDNKVGRPSHHEEVFSFDQGRVSRKIFSIVAKNVGGVMGDRKYEYDSNGKLIQASTHTGNGLLSSKEEFFYYGNGDVSRIRQYKFENGRKSLDTSLELSYGEGRWPINENVVKATMPQMVADKIGRDRISRLFFLNWGILE